MRDDAPKIIYTIQVERKKHIRRFLWGILAAVAAGGAWGALWTASERQLLDPMLLQVGQVLALGVLALGVMAVFLVRSVFGLIRALSRRNESARFYDRGFVWRRGKQEFRYPWAQVKTFREGARQLRLGGLVLGEMGAHELTMRDNAIFKITAAHGDTRQFAKTVRPYIADATGTVMGRLLRDKKSFRLRSDVVVFSGGVQVGKQKIRWAELDVAVKGGKFIVRRKNDKGKFKTVKSYGVHQVDNLGGFMELATSTIKNHQPERFNIKTQTPTYF